MNSGPVVGILFQRDKSKAAKRLSDLSIDTAGGFLCDEHLPLSEALEREWDCDAHFIIYSLVDEDGDQVFARVSKRSPFAQDLLRAGGGISVPLLVFDHDLPKTNGGTKQVWTEEGLAKFLRKLGESDLPSPTYFYTTLHGCRFLYVLDKPVDHVAAEGMVRTVIDAYKSRGIELDEACVDWTRLFRLPKTIREDTGKTFATSKRFMLLNSGPLLPADEVEIATESSADVFSDVAQYEGDIPTADQVAIELVTEGKNGQSIDTQWVKVAKKFLDGRDAYSVCFEHQPFNEKKFNGRNNAIVKTAGQIVGMTARQPEASPEGIYALLFAALEQLEANDEEGNDWHTIAWDIIKRMWSNEVAQIEAENKEKEASIKEAKKLREHLLEKAKLERPQDVPKDDEEAEKWFRQRMVASDGRQHHIMRNDGTYNVQSVSDSMVIPMIRELGMEDVIETHEMKGKTWAIRSTQSILNDHATPISTIVCSSQIKTAFIDGPSGHRTLNMPVHRLNPYVTAKFSKEVDAWFEVLFGDKYDIAIEWLSWCLEVAKPICALNLFGSSGTGKGMLAQGLAECFEGERLNNGLALGKYNAGLLDTPLVNCDEGVPNIKSDESLSIDQAFRTMVTGGNVTIRSMYQNPFNARIYPRILFTSNDRDILKSIVGHRDLTDDDIKAIEIRLLSIHVKDGAIAYLTSRGNYNYTAGWIHGFSKSRYLLAGHIHWLFNNRKPSQFGTGRLLVEGEVETTLVRGMRLRSNTSQAVVKALLKMIEANNPNRAGLTIEDGRVWVTPSGVVEYILSSASQIDEKISLPRCSQILRQFAINIEEGTGATKKSRPPGARIRGRWVEVDLGVLFEEALRYGTPSRKVEALLREQPDGKLKIAAAMAHSGKDD